MQSNTSGILRQPWVLLLGAAVVAFILFQLTATSRFGGAFCLNVFCCLPVQFLLTEGTPMSRMEQRAKTS